MKLRVRIRHCCDASQVKKQSAGAHATPEQTPLGKQLRSKSTVSEDPPSTPYRVGKSMICFDDEQGVHTGKQKSTEKGKRSSPPKPVRIISARPKSPRILFLRINHPTPTSSAVPRQSSHSPLTGFERCLFGLPRCWKRFPFILDAHT